MSTTHEKERTLTKQIERKVGELVDWLVDADLRQWQNVTKHLSERRRQYKDRIVGDEDSARLELDTARTLFVGLGAAPDVARLDAAATIPVATQGDLSLRELQVLRLLAAGETNRSIADSLYISIRTVDRHVSNLYTKLGVSNRAAATAHAS